VSSGRPYLQGSEEFTLNVMPEHDTKDGRSQLARGNSNEFTQIQKSPTGGVVLVMSNDNSIEVYGQAITPRKRSYEPVQ
jgi:hypothetical protein